MKPFLTPTLPVQDYSPRGLSGAKTPTGINRKLKTPQNRKKIDIRRLNVEDFRAPIIQRVSREKQAQRRNIWQRRISQPTGWLNIKGESVSPSRANTSCSNMGSFVQTAPYSIRRFLVDMHLQPTKRSTETS